MKKTFLTALCCTFLLSCQQDKKVENTTTAGTENTENKNEMVALMDKMMEEMHGGKPTGNSDKDYAVMMAAHHQGAVEMSELLLAKGKDPELKKFGEHVIAAQKSEIELIDKIPDGPVSPEKDAFQAAMHRSMAAMMDKNIPVHNDVDKDYAQQMIPHHQSTVDMANAYLKYGKNPSLVQLSNNIVKTQTAEIQQLKDWLNKNK